MFKNDLIESEYGTKTKCENTENKQVSFIYKQIILVTENFIHMLDLQNNYLNYEELLEDILADTAFMIWCT